MDSTSYIQLNRQQGLSKKLDTIAQNIANMNTTGYQREGVVFSEYIQPLDTNGATTTTLKQDSLSLATARARYVDTTQGNAIETGNTLDFALQGDGFFMIETPQGDRLTRNGHFAQNEAGELVTADGLRLLDIGGGPVFIPPQAEQTSVGTDGTVSADGAVIGRIGVFIADPTTLTREGAELYKSTVAPQPIEDTKVMQGYVESANVRPIEEMSDMITVQRAYEAGMNILQSEHERTQKVVQTLGRPV